MGAWHRAGEMKEIFVAGDPGAEAGDRAARPRRTRQVVGADPQQAHVAAGARAFQQGSGHHGRAWLGP